LTDTKPVEIAGQIGLQIRYIKSNFHEKLVTNQNNIVNSFSASSG